MTVKALQKEHELQFKHKIWGCRPLAHSPAAAGTGQADVLHTVAVLREGLGPGTAAHTVHACNGAFKENFIYQGPRVEREGNSTFSDTRHPSTANSFLQDTRPP